MTEPPAQAGWGKGGASLSGGDKKEQRQEGRAGGGERDPSPWPSALIPPSYRCSTPPPPLCGGVLLRLSGRGRSDLTAVPLPLPALGRWFPGTPGPASCLCRAGRRLGPPSVSGCRLCDCCPIEQTCITLSSCPGTFDLSKIKDRVYRVLFFKCILKKRRYSGCALSLSAHSLYLAFLHYLPCIPLSPCPLLFGRHGASSAAPH